MDNRLFESSFEVLPCTWGDRIAYRLGRVWDGVLDMPIAAFFVIAVAVVTIGWVIILGLFPEVTNWAFSRR